MYEWILRIISSPTYLSDAVFPFSFQFSFAAKQWQACSGYGLGLGTAYVPVEFRLWGPGCRVCRVAEI